MKPGGSRRKEAKAAAAAAAAAAEGEAAGDEEGSAAEAKELALIVKSDVQARNPCLSSALPQQLNHTSIITQSSPNHHAISRAPARPSASPSRDSAPTSSGSQSCRAGSGLSPMGMWRWRRQRAL